MEEVEIKPGIYWVGGIDWDLRNFHGYETKRGTTYNAYLIVDEKVVLVDTVKHYLFEEMVDRIKEIVDPSNIDIIVSNHVEMDHSGALPRMLELAPEAEIITSVQGEKGLRRHYKKDWNFRVAQSGDTVSIGKRTLAFVHIPMVHWPDSMVTYVPEENLLLPNDAFGQHIASSERFDDQLEWGLLREEAAKYYANIVLPYGAQVGNALDALKGLEIDMIGPSHGIIWRSKIPEITAEYTKWANHVTEEKAVIVYDTMWHSTEMMARKLMEGLRESGVNTVMRNLKNTHISDVMTDVLDSKYIIVGSPTLNNGMLPSVGGFLTYLKGLKPQNRVGLAFGSYGWGGQAVGQIEEVMNDLGWALPVESPKLKFVPDVEELNEIKDIGVRLTRN